MPRAWTFTLTAAWSRARTTPVPGCCLSVRSLRLALVARGVRILMTVLPFSCERALDRCEVQLDLAVADFPAPSLTILLLRCRPRTTISPAGRRIDHGLWNGRPGTLPFLLLTGRAAV
ncbi:hypothetical protein [Streptomyces sp. Inha503]|uniref:hypothetical protein n=1 Tax=Streptomyces sp. Inha503 TaxID=3383314 RepID=UPI0039A39721